MVHLLTIKAMRYIYPGIDVGLQINSSKIENNESKNLPIVSEKLLNRIQNHSEDHN